jgi:hypothetical protein
MGYGTRSCTVLLIDRSGHVTFHEQDKNENSFGAVRDYINVRAHRTGCNDAMPLFLASAALQRPVALVLRRQSSAFLFTAY